MVAGRRPVFARRAAPLSWAGSSPVMDVSLGFVLEAARLRLAALTPEVAGYVVLLALQAIESRPGRVEAVNVRLGEGGDIRVAGCQGVGESDAEASLRALLGALLAVCASPAPTMTAVVRRPAGAGLAGLAAELMAALIPVNHAAARRALARLHRETQRARELAVDAASAVPLAEPTEPSPLGGAGAPPADNARRSAAPAGERRESEPASSPGASEPDSATPDVAEPVQRDPDPGRPAATPPPDEHRSDVDRLLANFLAPARTREAMSRALRKVAGLDQPPRRRDK